MSACDANEALRVIRAQLDRAVAIRDRRFEEAAVAARTGLEEARARGSLTRIRAVCDELEALRDRAMDARITAAR